MACEHQHSNLVLLAKTSYRVDAPEGEQAAGTPPRWRTWIDYDRYHELWDRWRATGGLDGGEPFCSEDYACETPAWAVYGATERGMDPLENRWYHNRTVRRAKAGELSAEQLAQYPTNPADQTLMMGALEPYEPSESGCG